MNKYQILILAAAGALSFAASFGTNWLMSRKTVQAAGLPPESAAAGAGQTDGRLSGPSAALQANNDDTEHAGVSERQLQHLIFDIREKMRDYNARQRELDREAERLDIARQSLREEIEELNRLQEKLDLSLASIKERQEQIDKSVIAIEALERGNMQRLAATYERMDVVQAGKIMMSMVVNNQMQDVVKILFYMSERSAGRILGEIGTTRPEVAGVLSQQLKRVKEGG